MAPYPQPCQTVLKQTPHVPIQPFNPDAPADCHSLSDMQLLSRCESYLAYTYPDEWMLQHAFWYYAPQELIALARSEGVSVP